MKIIPKKIIVFSMAAVLVSLILLSCSFSDNSAISPGITTEVLSGDNRPGSIVLNNKIDSNTYKDNEELVEIIDPGSRLVIVLQNINFEDLLKEKFGIAIIDPDDSGLSPQEIRELKDQDKKIISYLSIGEAEEYRSYWQKDWEPGNPEFIDMENPCWPGNYRVNYWHKHWQAIIFKKIEHIVATGYDGAYLDLVDVYEFYYMQGRKSACYEMVQFIIQISNKAKEINPSFLIIPQNGEELIASKDYFNAIDGAGRENLWFLEGEKTGQEEHKQSLQNLLKIRQSNKFVFVVEYLDEEISIEKFKLLAEKHGFIPYVGTKELDAIVNTE